jgi:hypothetical protein
MRQEAAKRMERLGWTYGTYGTNATGSLQRAITGCRASWLLSPQRSGR